MRLSRNRMGSDQAPHPMRRQPHDDSLAKKDKKTCHIQPVDWFHDHSESSPRRPRYHKAFCYLECTARIGDLTATLDLQLYLRAKTVRRLNRGRSAEQRLHFRSKN